MTQRANPSINRPIEAYKSAGAIALAGGSEDGWISPPTEYSDISKQDPAVEHNDLNAFKQSSSNTSTNITIDPGEAFVFGSWIVKDEETNISLAPNTSGQTVYVGWDNTEANVVIIGLVDAFSDSPNDIDQRIPLYNFETDSSGVVSVTDRRTLGKYIVTNSIDVAERLNLPTYTDTSSAPQSDENAIYVDGSGSEPAGVYVYTSGAYRRIRRTDDSIEDLVAALLDSSGGITLTYDDGTDTLTIDGATQYTDEMAQDAVAAIINTDTSITVDYNDSSNTLTLAIDNSSITESEIDESISPTWSGNHTFNNQITLQTGPSADEHAATKAYVDANAQGLHIRDSSRVHSTSNIDLTSSADPNPIDDITLNDGNRILLKDQTDATENGIYVASTATDPTTWSRASDANQDSEVIGGMFTFVEEGTLGEATGWVLTGTNNTLGSDPLDFTKFSDAGTPAAGDALVKGGDTISHADTSSQTDVTSSDGSAITDLFFDEQGHTTSAQTTNLDQRYVESSGDEITGKLTISSSIDASQASEIISATYPTITDAQSASISEGAIVYIANEEALYLKNSVELVKIPTFEVVKDWVNNNSSVPEADIAKGFEARTDDYPSNPESGRVVFRTDKT